jgi:hypothetical protein
LSLDQMHRPCSPKALTRCCCCVPCPASSQDKYYGYEKKYDSYDKYDSYKPKYEDSYKPKVRVALQPRPELVFYMLCSASLPLHCTAVLLAS